MPKCFTLLFSPKLSTDNTSLHPSLPTTPSYINSLNKPYFSFSDHFCEASFHSSFCLKQRYSFLPIQYTPQHIPPVCTIHYHLMLLWIILIYPGMFPAIVHVKRIPIRSSEIIPRNFSPQKRRKTGLEQSNTGHIIIQQANSDFLPRIIVSVCRFYYFCP